MIGCKIACCQFDRRMPVIFEPCFDFSLDEELQFGTGLIYLKRGMNTRVNIAVTNVSGRNIALPHKTVIGTLQLVSSVTPVEVNFREFLDSDQQMAADINPVEDSADSELGSSSGVSGSEIKSTTSKDADTESDQHVFNLFSLETSSEDDNNFRKQLLSMELDGLSEDEQNIVKEMLWEERHAFAKSDEIGYATELNMNIKTTDDIPVQKSYNAIPKHLYSEVKKHIQDLLNRGWIRKSASSWSSPVVIVRKKDGDIRLCCDFRQLNKKTVPDKHPLPRIQDALDNLQGSKYFSVLDQSRAYYQGFMDAKSREKTAFVTP